jgi:hypothetical protein
VNADGALIERQGPLEAFVKISFDLVVFFGYYAQTWVARAYPHYFVAHTLDGAHPRIMVRFSARL